MNKFLLRRLLVLALGLFAGAMGAVAQERAPLEPLDLHAALPLEKFVGQLAGKRVVFVGESHDRYDHHLNQLEIIKQLYERDHNLAIGVEYFQQPFQKQVDEYISGRTAEDEFLRATEYFSRWGFDYRLYAPIFRYAREQHIPVRALNVPTALVSTVAKVGIAGLAEKDRAYLPKEIEPADEGYKNRLRGAFEGHRGMTPDAFNHFVEAQLVWDEGMAESAAAYLNANPERRLVVLAGAGHLVFGSGIPKRLERRTEATYAIVLSSGDDDIEASMADYLLLSKQQDLPPAGSLGVTLADKDGECRIGSVSPGGAAEKGGIEKDDVVTGIDAHPIKTAADVRLALWDKKPGERVHVTVTRKRFLRPVTELNLEVELAARPKLPQTR